MKILTITGTRPELIRLSVILKKLDKICEHKILYTGQNYDPKLKDIFFKDLGLRDPDFTLNCKESTLGEQLATIFTGMENAINQFKPDKVLVLGDTNSSVGAVMAERMGVPVYHMEAGNRCFDLKVPEEKNRHVIDAISSFNLPYTPGSRENLLREGYPKERIFVSGNPIFEVLSYYSEEIEKSDILNQLNLMKDKYVLVTAHRAENVDLGYRLCNIFDALKEIAKNYKVIFSCHPRTKARLAQFDVYTKHPNIYLCEPFGFFDFVKLQKNAKVIITDSGTVQEESCIFNVPAVTIRDSTERPETVECGSNIISGLETKDILRCFNIMEKSNKLWTKPIGYIDENVSDKVINFLLGK